jgi:2-alkyl-3-oxoalkanoate reductase
MTVLVTGGGGFLGKAIVLRLLARGETVRSYSRGDYPGLRRLGVELHRGDLTDADAVDRAVEGCELVFHVAAKPGIGVCYREYYQANVVGTENVLAACRKHQVRKLVYTSSPSVIFDGTDMEGVDESVPYPSHYEAPYPKTKAIAERLVLAANSVELATVALRPHLIWGPGDNHLIPRILERARAGRLRRIGSGKNLIDPVYTDDAAAAHILAGDKLFIGSPIAGKMYFISQGEPVRLWDLVNHILAAAGVPPVTKSISPRLAYALGWLVEMVYRVCGLEAEPPMTRFLARELATAHWFNIDAARRDLGYEPAVSVQEGLLRLRSSLMR